MKKKLYTVGYEGLDIDEFTQGLKKKKINTIIDIRKNPVSRKKGFSKRKMAEALQQVGIGYEHFGSLGVPTEWRKQAKEEIITRKKMFQDYERKILPLEEDTALKIASLANKKNIALLCYEKDASDCHRSFLIKKINQLSKPHFEVVDLVIDKLPISAALTLRRKTKK